MKINYKKCRLLLCLSAILLIGAMILSIIGISEKQSIAVYYISSDNSVRLKNVDGGYYINDVKLEEEAVSFSEQLSNSLGSWEPALPYIIISFMFLFSLFRLLKKLPPFYIWPSIITSGRQREKIIGKISLRKAPGGIIAVRHWNADKNGALFSLNRGTEWEGNSMTADKSPVVGGWHGIYALRLGTNVNDVAGDVTGIVSLSGKIVSHKDHWLRAQKCTILLLVTKKEKLVKFLGEKYNCPVILTSNIERTLDNWIINQEGIFWLTHNSKIISEKIEDRFEHDITELPAYKAFEEVKHDE